jgi:hypothetical protein
MEEQKRREIGDYQIPDKASVDMPRYRRVVFTAFY